MIDIGFILILLASYLVLMGVLHRHKWVRYLHRETMSVEEHNRKEREKENENS